MVADTRECRTLEICRNVLLTLQYARDTKHYNEVARSKTKKNIKKILEWTRIISRHTLFATGAL